MTDSSALLSNNTIAVSSDCLYNLKPSSVRARSYRASIPSSNQSTFTPGSSSIIYIPGGRTNTYLDTTQSYLRFTVKNNDASMNLYVDNIASSFINRIDIYHGSNLLETIQGYNILMSFLKDFQINASESYGLSNIYGTSASDTATQRQGLFVGVGQRITFCIPLLGCLGLGCEKAIPIGALYDDIRYDIQWEANSQACVWSGVPTKEYSVIDVQMELQIIEMSDEAESIIQSVTPYSKPVYIHGTSWRHYSSTLPSGTTGVYTCLVPTRQASLKGVCCLPRRSVEIVDPQSYSISSRVNPCIQSYNWKIGCAVVPQRAVQLYSTSNTGSYSEAFSEVLKFFDSWNHVDMCSSLSHAMYNVTDLATADTTIGGVAGGCLVLGSTATTTTSHGNAFAIAQNLESFAHRDSIMLSGINTLSSQVFFECTLGYGATSQAPQVNYTLDFFSWFDTILILENGILSAKF